MRHQCRTLQDEGRIYDYPEIIKESTVHFEFPLLGGREMLPGKLPLDSEEANGSTRSGMAVAIGRLVKQAIVEDRTAATWAASKKVVLNVQILNSNQDRSITGAEPPNKPIDVETYTRLGYPIFRIYEEPTDVCGKFGKTKPVNQLEQKVDHRVKPKVTTVGPKPPKSERRPGQPKTHKRPPACYLPQTDQPIRLHEDMSKNELDTDLSLPIQARALRALFYENGAPKSAMISRRLPNMFIK